MTLTLRTGVAAATTCASLLTATLVMGVLTPVAFASGPAPTPIPAPATPKPKPKPVVIARVGFSVQPQVPIVGVAYPLTVDFGVAVKRKTAAERGLVVTVNGRPASGAWSWRSGTTVMYRPRHGFWPARSRISLHASLKGVVLRREGARHEWVGNKASTRVVSFRTARSFIAYINGRSDRMIVKKDGKKVKMMLTSLGKPGFETRSGIKVATDKYVTRRMTSQGAGITDPHDQYDVVATYAVRITPTGEFIHGAPWARDGRFGHFNASHGCTNLTTADAKWYFDRVMLGDPVVTTGTGRPMEWDNGLGGPWNIPWKAWLARSALKGATS